MVRSGRRASLASKTESKLVFGLIKLGGSKERAITLETRLRTRIANSQSLDPDPRSIAKFQRLLANHTFWERRKPPCGVYNCVGQTWASRRTAVYEQADIDAILNDDGYRKLGGTERVLQGDVALYLLRGNGSAIHVGVVSELRSLTPRAENPVPWILSKWNDSLGEVLHHFKDVPWKDDMYEVHFWTERL
jgi:hypothetical protein